MSGQLKLPSNISTAADAHQQWLALLKVAETTVEEDALLQRVCAENFRIHSRALPPEFLGRNYARYCDLINKMYDAYLNSVHLQRSPFILEIITVFFKRLYELRKELVHLIINDYIYVDAALTQLRMTPFDIQIVVPYHFPLESRSDNVELALQKMWADAVRRKLLAEEEAKRSKPKLQQEQPSKVEVKEMMSVRSLLKLQQLALKQPEETVASSSSSTSTPIPEEFVQATLIQKHERFRQYYIHEFKRKSLYRRTFFGYKGIEPPAAMKEKAALIIQRVYRHVMKIRRQRLTDKKRDILLGIVADPFKKKLDYKEENDKMYQRRRNTRLRIKQTYLKELEQENTRLLLFRKEDQIDDITDEIREWFKEWFYGYGFFPEYPYPIEGGTLLVVRGQEPTVQEKIAHDQAVEAANKGKTKDQIKEERERAKADAKLAAEAERQAKKKEAIAQFKMKFNPFEDGGYRAQTSKFADQLKRALHEYRASWSIYDSLPTENCGEVIYGYMKELLQEDLMAQMHKECREYVDELMRLDLKLLTDAHMLSYKSIGMKYPKIKPRKKPKVKPVPKSIIVDEELLKSVEPVFDLSIVTKPKAKFTDVFGDLNYAAYDYNIRDPYASYPLPAFGDIKDRIMLSCVLGSGIQPGATRNKAVLLVGPKRYGKSFLVDVVAGELNAIKFDITPEVFSAVLAKPAKVLLKVFQAARAFQPSVIYMRDIERVFCKTVAPENQYLQATQMKQPLQKLIKHLPEHEKVIFIATCSNPFNTAQKALVGLFNEIILVPRADYGSLQLFFTQKLQRETSVPLDFPIQPIAQLCRGYGFGTVMDAYDEVMCPERIASLSVKPLSPGEFLEALLLKGEVMSNQEYQKYIDFYIKYSPIRQEREDYAIINERRAETYARVAKKAEMDAKMSALMLKASSVSMASNKTI